MNIGVISGFSPSYKELEKVAWPNHEAYCDLYGYKYFPMDFPEGERCWPKPRLIKQVLEENPDLDWVLWIDADAVFTSERPLTDILCSGGCRGSIMMSADIHGINCGVMLLENSPIVHSLLYAVNTTGYEMFKDSKVWSDQLAFRFFLSTPPYDIVSWWVDSSVFNAYLHELYPGMPQLPDSEWNEDSLILHCPGVSMEKRVEILGQYAKRIHI